MPRLAIATTGFVDGSLAGNLCCVEELRRPDDDELCGHVEERAGAWRALTVFGAELGTHDRREDAVHQVLTDGLPSLAGRWTLRGADEAEAEVVCIQEANAAGVTVAVGWYSMPGVPTRTIPAAEIAAGRWELRPLG